MPTVNNFLTDLVDETLKMGASCLTVEIGAKPVTVIAGERKIVSDSIVDADEFIEDLMALDIKLKTHYMQSYTHETENEEKRKVFVAVDTEDKHATFYISRLIEP